jgi:hypothetical protein
MSDVHPLHAIEYVPSSAKLNFVEKMNKRSMREFFKGKKHSLVVPQSAPTFDLLKSGYRTLDTQDPRLLQKRQRTPWWFNARYHKLTGSKLANAMGFFGLDGLIKVLYETYDYGKKVEEDEKEEIKKQECMAWGSCHEIDALATIVKHFSKKYGATFEECILTPATLRPEIQKIVDNAWTEILGQKWTPEWRAIFNNFLATSPDIKGFYLHGLRMVWELKCKYGPRVPGVYDHVPWYYIPQCQLHMLAEETDGCHFGAWSPTETRLWYVKYSLQFWEEAMPLLMHFHYLGLNRIVPTTLFDEPRTKRAIKFCKQDQLYLGSIPSVYSILREDELEYWEAYITAVQKTTNWPRALARELILYCQQTPEVRKQLNRLIESCVYGEEFARKLVNYIYP